MRMTWAIVVLAVAMGASHPAWAQDEKVGVTMGYPGAVGVLWQVSDAVAIRPEFSWLHQSSDSDGDSFAASSTDSSGVGVAISALVRLRQWGSVRAYVAPRFEASRTRIESTYVLDGLFGPGFPGIVTSETTEMTGTSYEGGASIGVQASPAPHFGVFGEVGVMSARSRTTQDSLLSSSSTNRARTVGIRSAVGVILFF